MNENSKPYKVTKSGLIVVGIIVVALLFIVFYSLYTAGIKGDELLGLFAMAIVGVISILVISFFSIRAGRKNYESIKNLEIKSSERRAAGIGTETDEFIISEQWQWSWCPVFYKIMNRSGKDLYVAKRKFLSKIVIMKDRNSETPFLTIEPARISIWSKHNILDSDGNLIGKISTGGLARLYGEILDRSDNVISILEIPGWIGLPKIGILRENRRIGDFYLKSTRPTEYVMNLSEDTEKCLDRRIGLALAIFLCFTIYDQKHSSGG